jgi:hypothetical protein
MLPIMRTVRAIGRRVAGRTLTLAVTRCVGERETVRRLSVAALSIPAAADLRTSAMPQTGQAPALSETTEGCIGQV